MLWKILQILLDCIQVSPKKSLFSVKMVCKLHIEVQFPVQKPETALLIDQTLF